MKIGILGTRGVPPRYGGFETFAGELGTRLVARGHHVIVYCRPGVPARGNQEPGPTTVDDAPAGPKTPAGPQVAGATWNGIERIVVPAAMGSKYFETVSHTFLSVVDALRRDFDAVLMCNAANAFTLPLLRAARIPVAINVDGIERHRRKWNVLGRGVYAVGESFSAVFADRVVADAGVIASYYHRTYAIEPATIPYGADFPAEEDSDVLGRLGLAPRGYLLYVSRFEPENNPLEVVRAYETLVATQSGSERRIDPPPGDPAAGARGPTVAASSSTPAFALLERGQLPPLVMLGQGLYARELVAELKKHESETVLFPGALYGPDYRTLQRNALIYIQATEVGGTHPALVEAMASGGCVVALGTPENREVGGDAIGYFQLGPAETLSGMLCECLQSEGVRERMRLAARRRATECYGWEGVTDAYEKMLRWLAVSS